MGYHLDYNNHKKNNFNAKKGMNKFEFIFLMSMFALGALLVYYLSGSESQYDCAKLDEKLSIILDANTNNFIHHNKCYIKIDNKIYSKQEAEDILLLNIKEEK
jgi:hypothetical protein